MDIVRPAVALACLVVLVGCSDPAADWERAEAQDTEAAYQAFLEDHPDGEWAVQARARLDALKDARDWENAQTADAIEAYNSYLLAHPTGDHMGEARQRITELEAESAWAAAQSVGTREALEDFLLRYADTPEAAQAREQLAAMSPPAPAPATPAQKPAPARTTGKAAAASQPTRKPAASAPARPRGDFQVQLGAFSTREKANAERIRLQQRFGAITGDLAVEQPGAGDRLYRVKSARMAENAARSACDKLKSTGQDCMVTR